MNFTINHLYTEPGIKFKISYKVDKFIRNKINEGIMKTYGLDKKYKTTFLNLIVSTRKELEEIEIKGADYDKKNDFINWGLWLPYKNIAMAENQLVSYLKYLFDAITQVLKNYNVKENDIREVEKIVEKEVVNNPEYYFVEDAILPPDLSKLGL